MTSNTEEWNSWQTKKHPWVFPDYSLFPKSSPEFPWDSLKNHKNDNFSRFSLIFQVCLNPAVTHILSNIINVNQGGILGSILFTIFIAAIMITWRKLYDRPLCIFRTKKDFISTRHRPTTKGIDFSLSNSEYADNTTVLFDSREIFSPLLLNHFEKFGMKVNIGHCNQPNKPSETEVLFVSAPLSSYAVTTTFDNRNLQPINLGQ